MLWWTVQTLVVAALLAGVVQMVCRFGRLGPVARHALWLVVLAKLVAPPVSALSWPWAVPDPLARSTAVAPMPIGSDAIERSLGRESFDGAAADAPAVFTPASMPAATFDALRPVVRDAIREWRSTILWIWLAGSCAFALIQIIRILGLALRLRRAEPAPDALTEVVAGVARRLAMAPIRIRVVDGMSSPLVYRAELLWPRNLDQETSARGLEGLIAHELAHVKRRDHWVGWLELVAGVVWWWNPLFWYLRSQIEENAELACDAWVVDTLPNGRRAYAEALLAICAAPPGTTPIVALGVHSGSRRVLERRLSMIMRDRVVLRLSRAAMLSVALLMVAALPAVAQQTPPPPPPPPAPAAQKARPPEPPPPPAKVQRAVKMPPPPPPPPMKGEFSQVLIRDGKIGVVANRVAVVVRNLPADAQTVLDRHTQNEVDAYKALEATLAKQREDTIAQLQELQDKYTKAGQLDEAVAVRDQIRMLQQRTSVVIRKR